MTSTIAIIICIEFIVAMVALYILSGKDDDHFGGPKPPPVSRYRNRPGSSGIFLRVGS